MPLFKDTDTYPVTPEQEAQRRSIGAALQSVPNVIASTAITGLAPDPRLPGVLGYLPLAGTAEGVAGAAGGLLNAGSEVVNAGLKAATPASWGLRIPGAPQWMTAAGQHFGATQSEIEGQLGDVSGGLFPKPDETTLPGQIAQIGGTAIGSGVGLFPGSLALALPRGLQTVGKVLLPSLEHIGTSVPITTTLGSAQGAADLLAAPTTAPIAPPSGDQPTSNLFGGAQAAPAQPDQQQQTSSLFATTTAPAATDDGSGTGLFGAPPLGPTFTQQGETETPLWHSFATLGIGLAAIFAGKYTHSLGAAMDDAGRTARFNDPEYAARTQAYTNDVISRGPNSGTLLPTGPSAVPLVPQGNPLHRMLTAASDATVNNAAKVQDSLNLTAYDPSMAERMSAMAGNIYDRQYMQDLVRNFMATGHNERTGINIPSPLDLVNDWARLDDARSDKLAMGLKSLDEINTRDYNRMLWDRDNPGVDPSLENVAHNLMGHGTDELRQHIAIMQADPQLADMAARYKQITDGTVDMGAHQAYGFFSPQEAADLKQWRSNYVPEKDINGKLAHPFGSRDTSIVTGQAQIMTHPVFDLMQHLEAIIPQFERNLFNQEMMYHWKDVQRAYPQSAQFMTDINAPTGAHASYYPQAGLPQGEHGGGGQFRDPIVVVRTPTGAKYVRVDDPITYGAMKNHSLSSARIQLGAANTAKRLFQQGTTSGLSSIATQRIVPGRTALFSGLIAPVSLPPHLRAGMADYVLQRGYGTTPPPRPLQALARGADVIGNLAGVPASYALGVGDRRIKNFADYTAPGAQNWANRWLRAMAGDAPVDAMHQAAQQRWENSGTKAVEGMYVSGSGSPGVLDAPGVRTGTRVGPRGDISPEAVRLQIANLAPKAFYKADWAGAKPYFMYMRNAVAEGFDHIASAGQEYVGRLNIDNPNVSDAARTYAIRNMFGNPGRTGSSWAAQKAGAYLPWLNIAGQELASAGTALGQRPFSVAATMATGLGTLAAISLLTHMRSQQHMDFLQNQISLQQREANVYIALNSDPTKPTAVPLPRSMRLAYAFMLDVMSKGINYIGARHDLGTFNGVWEGLKDFLGSHITTSDAMAMRHAGVDMMDVFNLPQYLGHVDYNRVIQDMIQNGVRSGLSNIPSAFRSITSGPVDKTMPDQAPATALDSKTGEVIRNILTNIFGAVAASGYNGMANVARYQTQGHPFLDSVGMGMRDWIQGLHEGNLSANNMLFETPIRLSKQPPIAEALEPTLYGLKNLPGIPQPAAQGYTGGPRADQLPIPLTGEQPVSNDPLINQMLHVAQAYKKGIDQAMAPINSVKAQMNAVDKQGMDPETKRNWMNYQTRVMADHYKLVQAYTSDMYHALSKLSGTTINSLGQINWQRGRDQFQH